MYSGNHAVPGVEPVGTSKAPDGGGAGVLQPKLFFWPLGTIFNLLNSRLLVQVSLEEKHRHDGAG